MQMKMMGRLLATALLSVVAGCGDEAGSPTANTLKSQEAGVAQCVQQFKGITSCAAGNARLTSTAKGLQVSGLADPNKDGVSSTFAKASQWTQSVDASFADTNSIRFSLAARANDQVVSTLQVSPTGDGKTLSVLPTFSGAPGGSSYRVSVYNNGTYVGGGVQPAGMIIRFNNIWELARILAIFSFSDYDIEIFRVGNSPRAQAQTPSPGACVWAINNQLTPLSVTLGDGTTLTGNQVEFVEQIDDGHYPYTGFTGIDSKASAKAYAITSESSVSAAQ